jgi:Zinc-finger of C2H2 type
MRLIHNPTAVVCPICQKHFNSDLYLKRHYASIHSINNTSGSDTEGGEKSTTVTNANANNSGTWSYQSNDGTIQTLQQ